MRKFWVMGAAAGAQWGLRKKFQTGRWQTSKNIFTLVFGNAGCEWALKVKTVLCGMLNSYSHRTRSMVWGIVHTKLKRRWKQKRSKKNGKHQGNFLFISMWMNPKLSVLFRSDVDAERRGFDSWRQRLQWRRYLKERQAQDSLEHRTRRLPRHAVSDKIKTFSCLLFRKCGHFPEAVSLTCFESMTNLLNCMQI